METLPAAFAKQLEREFDGRYRLRWSLKNREWHLEQRVGHGLADAPIRIDSGADDLIRAREGYAFVMAIRPGDRMPCPSPIRLGPFGETLETCGFELKVPVMETRETVCPKCRLEGRDGRHAAAYYPLNDRLIEHIRSIDYYLGHADHIAEFQDAANKARLETARLDELNAIDAVSLDVRKTFAGIEQVGYGGSIIRPVGDI